MISNKTLHNVETLIKKANKVSKKRIRWTEEENLIFENYISKKIAQGKEIKFDELLKLLPNKTKPQLYSKKQKSMKIVKIKILPNYEPIIKRKKEKFENQLLSYANSLNKEKDYFIRFSCVHTEEVVDIDYHFLKMLISLSNSRDSNNLMLKLDDAVFENIYSHLIMEKFYGRYKDLTKDNEIK